MTALEKFDRLESGGLWRDGKGADPRDVTVSFGKTTLVLSEGSGQPLAHWSLPAVRRRNPGTRPAIFAPDDEASETVEIEDDLMVDAIEQVRKALTAPQTHPGRLRRVFTLFVLGAIILGAAIWAPSALTQRTLSVVHQAKRIEIGDKVLGHYQQLTGPACTSPAGRTALNKLFGRLLGTGAVGRLVVVRDLPQGAVSLPGGVIMIDRQVIEKHDDPAVLAGYVLTAALQGQSNDPLKLLLDHAGLQATVALFTTGDVSESSLGDHAQLMRTNDLQLPDAMALRNAFEIAEVPADPYLKAINARPETRAAFDGMPRKTERPLIDDSDWVRLQGICGG